MARPRIHPSDNNSGHPSRHTHPGGLLEAAFLALAVVMTTSPPAPGQTPIDPSPRASGIGRSVSPPAAQPDMLSALQDAAARDPLLRAVLVPTPRSPLELVRCVDRLIDLEQFSLARPILAHLANANIGDEELAVIVERLGHAPMIKMSLEPDLQPEGGQFGDRALLVAEKVQSDPARLARLASNLTDDSLDVRRAAVRELRKTGASGILAVASALVAETDDQGREQQTAALAALGRPAASLAMTLRECQDPALRAAGCIVLGRTGDGEELLLLLAPAMLDESPLVRAAAVSAWKRRRGALPGEESVAALLANAVGAVVDRRQDGLFHELGPGAAETTHWFWEDSSRRPRIGTCTVEQAALLLSARLARDWSRIAGSADAQVASLALRLETAPLEDAVAVGEGTTSDGSISNSATLEQALRWARRKRLVTAAITSARLLGNGEKSADESADSSSSPPAALVEALRDNNPRVRFAAVEALKGLGARNAFAGSSWLERELRYFAVSQGKRKAVVVTADPQRGQNIAAWLREFHFEGAIETSGRRALRAVWEDPDVELVVLDDSLSQPRCAQLAGELRRDYRSRELPLMVLAEPEFLPGARRLVESDRHGAAFPRPAARADFAPLFERFQATWGAFPTSAGHRARQAEAARSWLDSSANRDSRLAWDDERQHSDL